MDDLQELAELEIKGEEAAQFVGFRLAARTAAASRATPDEIARLLEIVTGRSATSFISNEYDVETILTLATEAARVLPFVSTLRQRGEMAGAYVAAFSDSSTPSSDSAPSSTDGGPKTSPN